MTGRFFVFTICFPDYRNADAIQVVVRGLRGAGRAFVPLPRSRVADQRPVLRKELDRVVSLIEISRSIEHAQCRRTGGQWSGRSSSK